jgi:hypothetical protein
MIETAGPTSHQSPDACPPLLVTTVGGVPREAAERAAGTVALIEGTASPFERRTWEHVLGQSRAHGIVPAPAYRGRDLAETLAGVRGGLPHLREVISLADWTDFAASGSPAERLPDVRPGTPVQ